MLFIEDRDAMKLHEKLEKEHLANLTNKRLQLNDTNRVISDQVHEKAKLRTINDHIYNHDRNKVREHAHEVQTVDNEAKNARKQQQIAYREMLGSQVEFNKQIKMQGTMTETEKKFNKSQLTAYKSGKGWCFYVVNIGLKNSKYGSGTQFCRLPSVREVQKEDEKENLRRLEMMGYSRGYNNFTKSPAKIHDRSVNGSPAAQRSLAAVHHRHNNSAIMSSSNGLDDPLGHSKTYEDPDSGRVMPNKKLNGYNSHAMNSPSKVPNSPYDDRSSSRGNQFTGSAIKRAAQNSLDRSVTNTQTSDQYRRYY